MFREALKLISFRKVYPMSLLSTIFLFLGSFCLFRSNAGDLALMLSVAGFVVSMFLFLFFFTAQAQVVGNELTAEFQGEEPATVRDTLKSWKSYALPSVGVLVVAALMYQLIIPLIGSIAGGLFQVNVAGVEMNLLTLLLNFMLIVWTAFGLAEINTIGVGFKDTFSYTMNFVFTNFRKVVLFLLVFMFMTYLVMLLSIYAAGSLMLLPVQVLFMAYIIGFLNAYATGLFVDNVSDEDFEEAEEEEEAE